MSFRKCHDMLRHAEATKQGPGRTNWNHDIKMDIARCRVTAESSTKVEATNLNQ